MGLFEIYDGQNATVLTIFGIKIKFDKIAPTKRKIKRKVKYLGSNLTINDCNHVTVNTSIGNYSTFNGLKVHGSGSCIIGNFVQIGTECLIITSNHNFDTGKLIPYDETNINKEVTIDDFVWIGSRVTILPNTHIGEGAIIQAGSVVHGEIPKYAIAGGNPAKVFKYRDIEHFEKLKAEQKFYKHLQ